MFLMMDSENGFSLERYSIKNEIFNQSIEEKERKNTNKDLELER